MKRWMRRSVDVPLEPVEPAVALRRAAAARLIQGHHAGGPATARAATAPAGYVLTQGTSDLARHCELLASLPVEGEVRVVATPGRRPGTWHLDVGSRDRPGLLAAFTGGLAEHELDVVQAVVATWDDRAALQAFVVTSRSTPNAGRLEHALAASLGGPLVGAPVPDAEVAFRHTDGALYTSCDVRAPDRPGLLHALAVAIASAGADI